MNELKGKQENSDYKMSIDPYSKWRPLCIDLNCKNRPSFNLTNQKKGIYCSKHKKENMVNVCEKRMQYQKKHITIESLYYDKN